MTQESLSNIKSSCLVNMCKVFLCTMAKHHAILLKSCEHLDYQGKSIIGIQPLPLNLQRSHTAWVFPKILRILPDFWDTPALAKVSDL